jgi:hypothetical protein
LKEFELKEALKMPTALILPLAILVSPALGQDRTRQAFLETGKMQSVPGVALNSRTESSPAPHCDITGTKAIRITCHYTLSPATYPGNNREPRIVLNDATLSFKTRDDNYMHVVLTFTNDGKNAVADLHPVYLAIDDEAGNNYVRRLLPHVDFRSLLPGVPQTFSERLLAPALGPRNYIARLWIPNPDPSLKTDPAHNFLLSSAGVPDSESGLNLVAKFSVTH